MDAVEIAKDVYHRKVLSPSRWGRPPQKRIPVTLIFRTTY